MSETKILELEQRIKELEGQVKSMDSLAQDVASCLLIEAELQQRVEFEALTRTISTEFINLLPFEIDTAINNALKKVGKFTRADRCYVFTYCDEERILCNTHEYCNEGIAPKIGEFENIPAELYPWALAELERNGSLHVDSVDEFPSEAENERQQFIKDGVKAFAVFALRMNDRLIGFVGFDWLVEAESYSLTIASLLEVLGVVFSKALQRQKDEKQKEALIEKLRSTQEELLTLSIRDQLTGLFNRRHMEESLNREISRAKRHSSSLALIMLDVDHFKKVNDVYGHMAGDTVLQKIGEFLLDHSRGEDVVCRFGGEEFVLIMPGANKDSGLKRANELCRSIREDIQIDYRKAQLPPVTVSLGVAIYPENGGISKEILLEADTALYRAKEGGRNRAELA